MMEQVCGNCKNKYTYSHDEVYPYNSISKCAIHLHEVTKQGSCKHWEGYIYQGLPVPGED